MPKEVILGTLFPQDLNLNGDQANLLVIQKRLKYREVTSRVVDVKSWELSKVDLLFVGHGSIAAWEFIERAYPQTIADVANYFQSGKALLAVGSGALRVLKAIGREFHEGEHRSEFVDEQGLVGYLNSPVQDFIFEQIGNSWFTLLHGPVLAKNPGLADQIAVDLGWIETTSQNEVLIKLDELARESRKIAFES